MSRLVEKLTKSEWLIFIIVASMIGATFVISQAKVYVIKIKMNESSAPDQSKAKKNKKTIVFK
jgi:hypothetical protein